MKVFYKSNFKTTSLLFSFFALIGLSSCGTYQSAYNDNDGIYNTTTKIETSDTKVVTQNSAQKYFTKPYEEYMNIKDGDLITDVDNYYYNDELGGIENSQTTNYTGSSPWGYSDNASITINLGYNFGNYGYYGRPYFNDFYSYRFYNNHYNPWRYRNLNYYGFNSLGFYNSYYSFNPYYNLPYYGGYGFSNPYYNRNRYYRNHDTYGSRTAYNSRGQATNRRNTSAVNNRYNKRRVISNSVRTPRRVQNSTNNTSRNRTVRSNTRSRVVRNTGNTRTTNRTRTSSENTSTRRRSPSKSSSYSKTPRRRR